MLDYNVWFDNALGGDFTEFESGIEALIYTAMGLTQGATYQFKVRARNVYGYGEFSNIVTILAAQIPAQSDAPVTTFVAAEDNLVITWVAPDNGGSPITSYTI